MIFYLILCNILFIPLTYSSNSTVTKLDSPKNKTVFDSHMVNLLNKTKVTLQSEGGALLPDASVLALPKEKHTVLMNLENDLGSNKVKPVVARKGVVYTEENNAKPDQIIPTSPSQNSTVTPATPIKASGIELKNKLTTTVDIVKTNNTMLNKTSASVINNENKTEAPRKPTILSYDALAKMPINSSPETLVNQLYAPKKELKVYAKNPNSHPGMIMPLVITILLVPMFAVLGFMAFRRGQEAWKNRHYKRMDFLLDGMYND